jgi:Putative zinc-finger
VRRHRVESSSPRITHDRVVELLVDYHLGRLDPALNRAIEQHVARCPLCQLQGLSHTGTEKRVIQRRIRKAKPARRRLSRRGRLVIALLVVLVLAQLVVFELFFNHSHFFSGVISHASPVLHALSTASW